MRIKLLPAALLFLGSYLPLAMILAVQDIRPEYWSLPICRELDPLRSCLVPNFAHPSLVWTFCAVTALSLCFVLMLLRNLDYSTEMLIEESKTIPNDLINYAFPYIVSFMGVDLGSTGRLLGLGLFMFLLFLISYRSGQILMNPLLLAAGWQLYEIRADIEGNKRILRALSKDHVIPGQTLRSFPVQGIYILSKADHE